MFLNRVTAPSADSTAAGVKISPAAPESSLAVSAEIENTPTQRLTNPPAPGEAKTMSTQGIA